MYWGLEEVTMEMTQNQTFVLGTHRLMGKISMNITKCYSFA